MRLEILPDVAALIGALVHLTPRMHPRALTFSFDVAAGLAKAVDASAITFAAGNCS